jgi:hypothetical protein
MFHQEYIWSNRTRLIDELDRIRATGFKAIFLTVDNPGINGIRTRSIRYTGPTSEYVILLSILEDSLVKRIR